MAWLKAPLGAPGLPMTEMLAFSYAALQPSKELLDKYMGEIDKLEKQGKITTRDHQLLRSSQLAQDELMNLTLGEEDALTEQTVTETLKRVTDEITREESVKYQAEQASHRQTQQTLVSERAKTQLVQERLYWRCRRKAKWCSWAAAAILALVLAGGALVSLGLTSSSQIGGWVLAGVFGLATVVQLADTFFDIPVVRMREKIERWLLARMIRREAAYTGLDLVEVK